MVRNVQNRCVDRCPRRIAFTPTEMTVGRISTVSPVKFIDLPARRHSTSTPNSNRVRNNDLAIASLFHIFQVD